MGKIVYIDKPFAIQEVYSGQKKDTYYLIWNGISKQHTHI